MVKTYAVLAERVAVGGAEVGSWKSAAEKMGFPIGTRAVGVMVLALGYWTTALLE